MAVMSWAPGTRLRVLCVALFPLLALGQRATPARAAGAQVSAFFTVSPDDAYPFYHARGGVSPAPSNTRAFPRGYPTSISTTTMAVPAPASPSSRRSCTTLWGTC